MNLSQAVIEAETTGKAITCGCNVAYYVWRSADGVLMHHHFYEGYAVFTPRVQDITRDDWRLHPTIPWRKE